MMVKQERIPSWRKNVFGFELAEEVREEDGGDDMGMLCDISTSVNVNPP